jgi:hypothetical protein
MFFLTSGEKGIQRSILQHSHSLNENTITASFSVIDHDNDLHNLKSTV